MTEIKQEVTFREWTKVFLETANKDLDMVKELRIAIFPEEHRAQPRECYDRPDSVNSSLDAKLDVPGGRHDNDKEVIRILQPDS